MPLSIIDVRELKMRSLHRGGLDSQTLYTEFWYLTWQQFETNFNSSLWKTSISLAFKRPYIFNYNEFQKAAHNVCSPKWELSNDILLVSLAKSFTEEMRNEPSKTGLSVNGFQSSKIAIMINFTIIVIKRVWIEIFQFRKLFWTHKQLLNKGET